MWVFLLLVPVLLSSGQDIRDGAKEATENVNDSNSAINQVNYTCGLSNSRRDFLRSKNDIQETPTATYTDFGEFPWIVAILKNTRSTYNWNNDYVGAGILVHPSVVLTVAHRINDINHTEIICRAGEWDAHSEYEFLGHQDRNVRKISIHDEFVRLYGYNDAAMLFLESPFVLENNPHLGVACLSQSMPPPGTNCYTIGWGKINRHSEKYENDYTVLKKLVLSTLDEEACERQFRQTRLGSKFKLHQSLMCAGVKSGADPCTGDSGSPLVCSIQSYGRIVRYAVYGLLMYTVGCELKDIPRVYLKVPSAVDWMNRLMDEQKLTKFL